jgi:hypothetical protein
MGKIRGQPKPFWPILIRHINFPLDWIKLTVRCGNTCVGSFFLPTMFPSSVFDDILSMSPTTALTSPAKSILHTPKYTHLPAVVLTTMEPLPTPPYAAPSPPPVLHLLKQVGPNSIYQLLRYWGLPKDSSMYLKGWLAFRNTSLSFLVTDCHRKYKPCVEPTWPCEFCSLTKEMESYGPVRGMQELVNYTCNVHGLFLDMVRFFWYILSFVSDNALRVAI